MAIGSIVIIGTLIAGVFFVATQENRLGRNTGAQEQAFRGAEAALAYVYGTWNNANMAKDTTGSPNWPKLFIYDSSSKGFIDTVRVTRLTSETFQILSIAYSTLGGTNARHRTGGIIRVAYPSMSFIGALTERGPIQVGGNSYINGYDSLPPGWSDCPPLGPAKAGLSSPLPRGQIDFSGCTRLKCVDGSPDLDANNAQAADTTKYFNYGPDANWATLTSAANLTFAGSQTLNGMAPSLSGGVCNTADNNNWGDMNRANPAGPCESYFPIIYFSGTTANVHLTTGSGQGIMLVDGDLQVDGGFTWVGPVIVRGHFATAGTGGHVIGAVMAADVNLEQNSVLGNALIQYSSCGITNALKGAGISKKLAHRSWAEMF
jgi:Tfp pilus assembly protein PilX